MLAPAPPAGLFGGMSEPAGHTDGLDVRILESSTDAFHGLDTDWRRTHANRDATRQACALLARDRDRDSGPHRVAVRPAPPRRAPVRRRAARRARRPDVCCGSVKFF